MKACCENCKFSIRVTDIPGLVDCELEERTKDTDMICDAYKEIPVYGWNDSENDTSLKNEVTKQ